MSWDSVCDETGSLEIIVSRWYSTKGNRREVLTASGFEPYEPVEVEIIGADDSLVVEPLIYKEIKPSQEL